MPKRVRIDQRRIRQEECKGQIVEKLVFVNRVAKVVKGGRRFSFSALVVVGDGMSHVGFATGKAGEVADAIAKATERAKKNMFRVPLIGSTVPHEVLGKFGPCTVIMKPAPPGTGIIAGSAVRAVIESIGIKDIRTKIIGSRTAHMALQATVKGLMMMRDPEETVRARGKTTEELHYSPF